MNFVLLILVLLGKLGASFDVKPIDGDLLRNIFAHTIEEDTLETIHTVYLDEQCALDCVANLACINYSYNESASICKLRLLKTSGTKREVNEQVNSFLGCDVQSCSQVGALFCSTSKSNGGGGMCLCEPSRASGERCEMSIVYELAEWSAWSSCSASCDEGFRLRKRECYRKNIDSSGAVLKREVVEGTDWQCDNNNQLGDAMSKHQVETCTIQKCQSHSEWSKWSACSRLCNGVRTRTRTCTATNSSNPLCDPKYLGETQSCSSLADCDYTIIRLISEKNERSETSSNVTKRGLLSLFNTRSKTTDMRIFTHTNSMLALFPIGRLVCAEMGFSRFLNILPREETLQSNDMTDSDYLAYVNSKVLNGLICLGNETTFKECHVTMDADMETTLYELDIECTFDGGWSLWSSWSECVDCGIGTQTRKRECTDPAPSLTEVSKGNGKNCSSSFYETRECVLKQCNL